jgi:putative addiction module killer protein
MRPVTELVVELYSTRGGRIPFQEWMDALRDVPTLDRINMRLARLRSGNLGDHRMLAGGLFEMRLFYGPDYRIYGAKEGAGFILLLCGGDKGSQRQDIETAQAYCSDYRKRTSAVR